MLNNNSKALGCLSLLVGFIFSTIVHASVFGSGPRFNPAMAILAPAWNYFDPGRDDGVEIILATVADTIYYAVIIYFIARVIVWLSGKFKTF